MLAGKILRCQIVLTRVSAITCQSISQISQFTFSFRKAFLKYYLIGSKLHFLVLLNRINTHQRQVRTSLLNFKRRASFSCFLRIMIVLFLLCLVLEFGKTDFFRMRIEKASWKRKGTCTSYSRIDPLGTGHSTSYISKTCNFEHVTLENCSIEGKWNIASIN